MSDIPWNGPIGAVRIGLFKDEIITFPTRRQLHESDLDLIITGVNDNLVRKYKCIFSFN